METNKYISTEAFQTFSSVCLQYILYIYIYMCLQYILYIYKNEKSKEKINFLDVPIKIQEGRIITDFFCKPTAGHQYLHYDSCHADHITSSIRFSQTTRLKRICPEKNDFNPIQEGRAKKAPFQFFSCNFYRRTN